MKILWIFAVLLGIFAIARALPVSSEEHLEDIPGELETPEETPPVEEGPVEISGTDHWGSKNQVNVIEAPLVCPEGQLIDHTGVCRDMW